MQIVPGLGCLEPGYIDNRAQTATPVSAIVAAIAKTYHLSTRVMVSSVRPIVSGPP